VGPPPASTTRANPHWADRDRFVLSNGHGSMLLYALLHLTGYDAADRRSCSNFRQLHSEDRRPPRSRHHARASKPPPARWARASPMPWAWRWPRSCWPHEFNRDGHTVVDHHTYVFLGDGCLMEGISHEAVRPGRRLEARTS
jgi:transketolase